MNRQRLDKIEKRVRANEEPVRVIIVYEGEDPDELADKWFEEHPDHADDDAPLIILNK